MKDAVIKSVKGSLSMRTKRYNGKDYHQLTGSMEGDSTTFIVSIDCDSSGHPKIYTSEKGKNFVYARFTACDTKKLKSHTQRRGGRF